MSEASMRSNLVKKLRPLDAVAIESPTTGIGISDVNYTGGWIECKWLRSWPVRCDTQPVRFKHPLTKEQHIWTWRRERAGGTALICAQVSKSWFFWSGFKMKEEGWWDNMTRPQMIQNAELYFPNGLQADALIEFLKGR